MNARHTSYFLAFGTLIMTIIVWILVIYIALLIQNNHARYGMLIQTAVKQSDQSIADARLHIFANGNLARLANLDALVSPGVSSITDIIKSIGDSAGVPIKISGALPGNIPNGQKDVHAIAFVIESTGSFSSLMRAFALFEVSPVPSSIESVDFSRVPKDDNSKDSALSLWHMSLKMRVLTTAPVSL